MYRDATETGGVGFSAGAVEHGWCPSPSPPAPFLSRAAGEEGGVASGTTRPPSAPTRGEEGGACLRHYPLAPRPLPPGARKGELVSGTTPWPPVRSYQGRGRESLPPALPPGPPVRSYQGRGRGSLPPAHPLAPPSAATRGEEGGACLRHYPLAPVRSYQGRGRGSLPPALPPGPLSAPTRGEEGGDGAKVCWHSLTQ